MLGVLFKIKTQGEIQKKRLYRYELWDKSQTLGFICRTLWATIRSFPFCV